MSITPKKSGDQFESLFYRACIRSGIGVVRIADGCRRVGSFKRFRLIPVKQACDWVLAYNGKAALIDTKTQGSGKTFAFASINLEQVHAIRSLVMHGILGGYVVWLRQVDKLVFFSTDLLLTCKPGESLSIDQGIDLGTIENPDIKMLFV